MSSIRHIFIAAARGAPMQELADVEALAEIGLAGDRYTALKYRGSPDKQLTLIEWENILAFNEQVGATMTPDAPRRNLVTSGVRLNDLVGARFRVGPVLVQGLELCEPCSLMKKRSHPEAIRFFRNKGGLRAQVLDGGVIVRGAAIVPA